MATLLVNIDVPDLEQGITFYTAAFGLHLTRRLGSGFAELLGADAPIYLLENSAGTRPFRVGDAAREQTADSHGLRRYSRHWTPVHLDFVVPDLEAGLARALAAGATQEGAVSDHSYGRLVLLSDPFGHGECLLEFNDQGYDAIASVP